MLFVNISKTPLLSLLHLRTCARCTRALPSLLVFAKVGTAIFIGPIIVVTFLRGIEHSIPTENDTCALTLFTYAALGA